MRRRSLVLAVLAIALIIALSIVTFGVGLDDVFGESETGPGSTATSPTSGSSPTVRSEPTATPTQTIVSTPTATPTRAPSTGYTDAEFYQALKNGGIAVSNAQFEQAAQDRGNLSEPFILEYTTETTTANARREEIGRIADIYARAVANGYQRTRLTATAFNESGRPVADYHIERDWALVYAEGDLSAEEYGQRIGETMSMTTAATPSQTRTTETPTPTREPSEGYTDAEFRDALADADVQVDYLEPDGQTEASGSTTGAIIFEYTTPAESEDDRRTEVGVIAEVYAQAVADGYQRGPVYATAYNEAGRPVAKYTIQRQWARAYAAGDISAKEYGQLIDQTYQSFGTSTEDDSTTDDTTATESPVDMDTDTETTDESEARRVTAITIVREQVDSYRSPNQRSDERVQGMSVL